MRINKFLAESGVASRRKADEIILEKRVKINGKLVRELGIEVNQNKDTITVDNNVVKPVDNFTYLLFNKPKGCVTTVEDDRGRKTVMDFIDNNARLFPIGRLDYDSEGMLIITNDGDLSFRLTHPMNEIYKTYIVKIEGEVNDNELAQLRNGVIVDGKKTQKSMVKVKSIEDKKSRIEIKIKEGRNHQIKKMFDAVGKNVTFLKRVAIGDLRLGGLKRGEYRNLTDEEIFYLKNL